MTLAWSPAVVLTVAAAVTAVLAAAAWRQDGPMEPLDGPDETRRCPDAGRCHHGCTVGCFRVAHCAPLSGTWPDGWPADVRSQQTTTDGRL